MRVMAWLRQLRDLWRRMMTKGRRAIVKDYLVDPDELEQSRLRVQSELIWYQKEQRALMERKRALDAELSVIRGNHTRH